MLAPAAIQQSARSLQTLNLPETGRQKGVKISKINSYNFCDDFWLNRAKRFETGTFSYLAKPVQIGRGHFGEAQRGCCRHERKLGLFRLEQRYKENTRVNQRTACHLEF